VKTTTSELYRIGFLEEAQVYLGHSVLEVYFYEITRTVLDVKRKTAFEVF
jgi:uncharacterized protein (DUF1810 family)